MPHLRFNRRRFLKSVAAAPVCACPTVIPATVLARQGRLGANDRIEVGIIGCGVRGKYLIGNMPEEGRVVSVCDCSTSRIADTRRPEGQFVQTLRRFSETEGRRCTIFQDYRQMIDRQKMDAVMIATPDHHHVLAAMLACQANMDVYCEKPLTLTIREGRALTNAVQRYQRVLQVGSQQRSMQVNRDGCEFVRRGGLGKISHVELRNYPGPIAYTSFPKQSAPSSMDWEMFIGPTAMRPYHRNLWVKDDFKIGSLLWRGWDLYRSYSGHLMTNWGGHGVDMVQYALGTDRSGPVAVIPQMDALSPKLAARWMDKSPALGTIEDRRQDLMRFCPVTVHYANGVELRFVPDARRITFYGQKGTLAMSRNQYVANPKGLLTAPDPTEQAKWQGAGHVARPHIQNWFDCIKSRKQPVAPVEVGHRTATICHLANLARELQRPLRWDPETENILGDDEANRLTDRPRRKGFELPTV